MDVAGAFPRVVGDENITWPHGVTGVLVEKMSDRGRQAANEAGQAHGGLGQRSTLGIGQDDGEVIAVAHQG